ncbi:hypothetical protein ACFPRL_24670 [Pseudoclavibacter helvolus]
MAGRRALPSLRRCSTADPTRRPRTTPPRRSAPHPSPASCAASPTRARRRRRCRNRCRMPTPGACRSSVPPPVSRSAGARRPELRREA